MIGGGPRPDAILEKIVELSAGKTLLVIPMASSIPDTVGWEHRDKFISLGARAEALQLSKSDSSNSEILDKIKSAGGIWFSGGDQNRLMEYVGAKSMREAIHFAYENGAVISGTSAGTAVQSEIMITGDEKFPFENRNLFFSQIRPENVMVTLGLGLTTEMIVDQHFIRRRRLNRLINILGDSDVNIAIGIDEATALWLKPNNEAEVLGNSQIIILEKSESTRTTQKDEQMGLSNILMHIVPSGSSFSYDRRGISSLILAGE